MASHVPSRIPMDGVGVLDYGQRSVSSFLREERASSTDMVGRHSPSVLVSNGAFPVPDLPMYARDDVAGAPPSLCQTKPFPSPLVYGFQNQPFSHLSKNRTSNFIQFSSSCICDCKNPSSFMMYSTPPAEQTQNVVWTKKMCGAGDDLHDSGPYDDPSSIVPKSLMIEMSLLSPSQ